MKHHLKKKKKEKRGGKWPIEETWDGVGADNPRRLDFYLPIILLHRRQQEEEKGTVSTRRGNNNIALNMVWWTGKRDIFAYQGPPPHPPFSYLLIPNLFHTLGDGAEQTTAKFTSSRAHQLHPFIVSTFHQKPRQRNGARLAHPIIFQYALFSLFPALDFGDQLSSVSVLFSISHITCTSSYSQVLTSCRSFTSPASLSNININYSTDHYHRSIT